MLCYKYVATGVHAQVLDFPAAITWVPDLEGARKALAVALVDVAEAAVESGQALPVPDPKRLDPEMDLEEPIDLLFRAGLVVAEVPGSVWFREAVELDPPPRPDAGTIGH